MSSAASDVYKRQVLRISPECIRVGGADWEGFDFFVDCSGYIGSINLDSLERLGCSVVFKNCNFVGQIIEENKIYQHAFIFTSCHFQGFRFFDCAFKERIDFDSCIFAQGVIFSDSEFNKKVRFSACIFEREATFVRTKFMEASSFIRSIFEDNAIFYGAEFNKLVNFNQAIFKGEASFVNAKLKIDYQVLKGAIRGNANTANDYRDSFRSIKSILLKIYNTCLLYTSDAADDIGQV